MFNSRLPPQTPDNLFRNGADSFRSRKRNRYLFSYDFWNDAAGFVLLVAFIWLLMRLES